MLLGETSRVTQEIQITRTKGQRSNLLMRELCFLPLHLLILPEQQQHQQLNSLHFFAELR